MLNNVIKTFVLLFGLSLIFLSVGYYIGGTTGLTVAFILALGMNFISFFFSDKMVLRIYRAKPLDPHRFSDIYSEVAEISNTMKMPPPKLYLVDSPVANAFATGRGPGHASVAVTTGILDILNPQELRGVLAHELSHVKNRDVLISTIAATLATAISYFASISRYIAFWGTPDEYGQPRNNPISLFLIALFAPFAATLIQLGVSRSREYYADESGAYATHDPMALASALEKLEANAKIRPFRRNMRYVPTNSLGIVRTFRGSGILALFSTHPPMRERVKRLKELQQRMF